MTERKWTPGPWVVPDQTWSRTLTVNTGGGMDAIMIPCAGSGGAMSYTDEVCALSWNDDGEWLANARLIAAAPDLYEALCECINDMEEGMNVPASAYAAIRKVRGE